MAPTRDFVKLLGAVTTAFLTLTSAHVVNLHDKRQAITIDQYITNQTPISKAGVLANIGPNGAKDGGAASGVVIASPSTSNPDYLYTWTRDSALVYKMLIDQYVGGQDTDLGPGIDLWVASQGRLQLVSNPSGTVTTGGLGEPKFLVNEAAFTGGWGRPQRDGPALRAIAFITYANYLRANGQTSKVTSTLWPILQRDLDYVRDNWSQGGFDLWEEVNGKSFFTTAVQHRALREGAALATALGETARASQYTTQAANVLCFQQSYWSSSQSYTIANLEVNNGRSGLDANSILASIHTFDPNAGCDAHTFQPCSDKALASHYAVVNSFRSIYVINSGIAANKGVAVGRYKEDSYYGGHPWYLTTFAAAEQLYDALYTWNKIGSIPVTSISLPFFKQFLSTAVAGSYASGTTQYTTIYNAVKTFADEFVLMNAKYTPSNGGLAEQYDRSNGAPKSASDLTWSYAAAITAFERRAGVVPPTWGASSVAVPSSTCNPGGGGGGGDTVAVTFAVTATTVWGENIFVTGSIPQLVNWDPNTAVALSSNDYPVWKVTVNLPASTTFQYKYIRKNGGSIVWESDPNRSFTTPSSGSYTINDTWR